MIKNIANKKADSISTSLLSSKPIYKNFICGAGQDGDFYSTGNYQYTVTGNNYIVKQYNNFTLNTGHIITVSDIFKGLVLFVKGRCIIDGTFNLANKGYMTSGEGGTTAALGYSETKSGRLLSVTPFCSGFSSSLITGIKCANGATGGTGSNASGGAQGGAGGAGSSGSCFGGGNGGGGGSGGSTADGNANGSVGSAASYSSGGNGASGVYRSASTATTLGVWSGSGGGGSGLAGGTGGATQQYGFISWFGVTGPTPYNTGATGTVGIGSSIYIICYDLRIGSSASINVSGISSGGAGSGAWIVSGSAGVGATGGGSGGGSVTLAYVTSTINGTIASHCTVTGGTTGTINTQSLSVF
jgi:hypothetical protein